MISEKALKRIYVDRKGNKYKFIEGIGCDQCCFYRCEKSNYQSCWDFQQHIFGEKEEAPGCCEKHVLILIQDNLKLWRKI